MTKFELPSFQTGANSQKFKDNWDATFGKKDTSCKFDPECKRKIEEGNMWCNFHLITEGHKPCTEPSALLCLNCTYDGDGEWTGCTGRKVEDNTPAEEE
jgi:hypothetical protein